MNILRLGNSSYYTKDFIRDEKYALEQFSGVSYFNNSKVPPGELTLITNTHVDDLTPYLANLKLLIHPNSGFDNLIKLKDQLKEIPVILGNPLRAQAVTEYTLSCLFHFYCPIKNYQKWPLSRTFNRPLLSEQKALIIGEGHIGSKVVMALQSIGVKVTVIDPYTGKPFKSKEQKDFYDILIIACDLNEDSYDLINDNYFETLKDGFILINAARAEIIKESSLIKNINRSQKIFLDVFREEPFSPNHLHSQNINRTPHIAGVYQNLLDQMIKFEVQVFQDFLNQNKDQFLTKYEELTLSHYLKVRGLK